jgi:sec-independent protein translocase protein TatA
MPERDTRETHLDEEALMTLATSTLHPTMAAFGGLGAPEVIIIILVVLLLFGGRKLPEVARGTGRALRIFKAETKGLMDNDDDDDAGDKGASSTAQQQPPQQITRNDSSPPAGDPSVPADTPTSTNDPLPPTHTEK